MNMLEAAAEVRTWHNRLGPVASDAYYRQDIFDAEMARVFTPSWLCVGFSQDLQHHQDFITAQIGSRSIVVQNFHGVLKAFLNVCSHRFSRIQCAAGGNRPLSCPYHGWTYDADGVPIGIPLNKQGFGFSSADRQALALKAYAVETVGHFVFVRMDDSGADLRDYLGGLHDSLHHLSEISSERFDRLQATWPFNWKTGVDNAAEGYHVPLVHPESYSTALKPGFDMYPQGEHIYYLGQFKEGSVGWWEGVVKALKLRPSLLFPQYACFMIFPNLVVNVNYGTCLSALVLDPLDPQKTAANAALWMAPGREGPARDMVLASIREFSATVRREDHDICVAVQSGFHEVQPPRAPILGEMEVAVRHFHNTYAARMQEVL